MFAITASIVAMASLIIFIAAKMDSEPCPMDTPLQRRAIGE